MRERVKQRVGVVVSAKAAKTVVVRVDRLVQHPLYGKRIRQRTRFMAHDERGECHEGDRVLIIESPPISRRKRWRVSKVLTRAPGSGSAGVRWCRCERCWTWPTTRARAR
jgi:small subunit ribosomal protein S17